MAKSKVNGGTWRAGATMGSIFVFVCSFMVMCCCVVCVVFPPSFIAQVWMSGCAEDCAVDGYRVLSEITNAALGGIYNIYTLLKFPDLTQASQNSLLPKIPLPYCVFLFFVSLESTETSSIYPFLASLLRFIRIYGSLYHLVSFRVLQAFFRNSRFHGICFPCHRDSAFICLGGYRV